MVELGLVLVCSFGFGSDRESEFLAVFTVMYLLCFTFGREGRVG